MLTGGTGSFGKRFTRYVLGNFKPESFIVVSRDELKQFEMAQIYSPERYPALRYCIGDVRDRNRLSRLFEGIDYVVHAAAQKQVPAAEDNPTEAVKTNILGAMNIIDVAIDRGVKKVVALSTDKAANPVNLYGATKLCSDKLFIAANQYSGSHPTRFSIVRYGNVVGSRGSVIPFFERIKRTGEIPITDERMTRFMITLEQGIKLVMTAFETMNGGEIFVPKIPSMTVMKTANAIAPGVATRIIGIRPGEKLHESLISADDARNTIEYDHLYVILPQKSNLKNGKISAADLPSGARNVPEDFSYSSDNNTQWLDEHGLHALLKEEQKYDQEY